MNLTPTDVQAALREAARGFLERAVPAGELGAVLDSAPHWRPEIWPRVAELGWLGISAPESRGGAGLGIVEESIVAEEAGAALLPAPLHSALAFALTILPAADEADDLLRSAISGEAVITFAWAETQGRARLADAGQSTVRATCRNGGWRLEGAKSWVPDAERSDGIIVPAQTPDGVGLFYARRDDPNLDVRAHETLDMVRPLAHVRLDASEARLLVAADAVPKVLANVRMRALVLAAAESVGMAQRMLDITAAYTTDRRQFGRPIATYQAVSHQLAAMYVTLELARSLVLWASMVMDEREDLAPIAVASAAARAIPAAVSAAETAIQLHGGVGTTWESPLHRYLKHALALATIDGPPGAHRSEIVRLALMAENARAAPARGTLSSPTPKPDFDIQACGDNI
jgi:alkylation response protein AidB-like acyl-CoA dehydrogenase